MGRSVGLTAQAPEDVGRLCDLCRGFAVLPIQAFLASGACAVLPNKGAAAPEFHAAICALSLSKGVIGYVGPYAP